MYLLALDQGTTSSRAIVFNKAGLPMGVGQHDFAQFYPREAWVEHDPQEIWQTTRQAIVDALAAAAIRLADINAIGITNQRETTVVWDRASGEPVYPAIVWQDRRTADLCQELKDQGHEPQVQRTTGLLLDPYFSATKIHWILDNVAGARARAEAGELAFGTIDSWLLWQLTDGKQHCTDATNASRTLLFDLQRQCWSEDMLALFDIPASLLPEVKDSADDYGQAVALGEPIAIGSLIGDQQSALVGEACFAAGQAKSTYGTGCFLMVNTGEQCLASTNRLLSTVAYRLDGVPCYALEGSIFMAGAAVQWLRDKLGVVARAADTEAIARERGDPRGVYVVPAFTGLGAPHWEPQARGAIMGMTRDSDANDIIVATLDSVCYQTMDLLNAMTADGTHLSEMRIDGGMAANNWFCQRLADICGVPAQRPLVTETTALGAASLAGLQQGIYSSLAEIAQVWQADALFKPEKDGAWRERGMAGWKQALGRVKSQP